MSVGSQLIITQLGATLGVTRLHCPCSVRADDYAAKGMRPAAFDRALEAGRHWYARHGRPAAWCEWEHAEPGRPSSKTVSRRWGWHAFWTEVTSIPADELYPASDQGRPTSHRHLLDWSSEEMLEALRAARRAEGRWPSSRAWEVAAEDHPTRRAYVRRFGSWAAAIEAAGAREPV